tara:strand:+ start:235 stop:537 length:303 start_codon:yes stop_codon:yes gene_type:complete
MEKQTFTKHDIVKNLSYKLNMNYEESVILFECVLDTFHDCFKADAKNTRIEIRNFGVFDISLTKKRTNARNPKTKELVTIPPRKKITFKPSKKIKEYLYK